MKFEGIRMAEKIVPLGTNQNANPAAELLEAIGAQSKVTETALDADWSEISVWLRLAILGTIAVGASLGLYKAVQWWADPRRGALRRSQEPTRPYKPFAPANHRIQAPRGDTTPAWKQTLAERLRAWEGQELTVLVPRTFGPDFEYSGRLLPTVVRDGETYLRLAEANGRIFEQVLSDAISIRTADMQQLPPWNHPRLRDPAALMPELAPKFEHPQYKDRALHLRRLDGAGHMLLVDFEDPRLTQFLETHMSDLRSQLDAGTVKPRAAAAAVNELMNLNFRKKYDAETSAVIPLGDLIEQRSVLARTHVTQLALQFIGIRSRIEYVGDPGTARRARIRIPIFSDGHQTHLILDPELNDPRSKQAERAQALPQPDAPPQPPRPAIHLDRSAVRRNRVFVLGRGSGGLEADGSMRIQITAEHVGDKLQHISSRHFAIRYDRDMMRFEISDLNSVNGTYIHRKNPLQAWHIIAVGSEPQRLQQGDRIQVGGASFEWDGSLSDVRLNPISVDSQPQQPALVPAAARALNEVPEVPLIERLRAQDDRRVELFIAGDKDKYVGRLELIERALSSPLVRIHAENFVKDFELADILTVRNRRIDLTSQWAHPRITDPQFRDPSINVSRVNGDGKVVLVDFSDPRLTGFLEGYMEPLRAQLDAGEITSREAAETARQIVQDFIPYDRVRGHPFAGELANQRYRLGDFIEKGVCNERGMLLQVSLQYIGVDSRMEKGSLNPFGARHAWVRARFPIKRGDALLILDPQMSRAFEVGVDAIADSYQDDSTPFARDKIGTVVVNDMKAPLSETAERLLDAEVQGFEDLTPERRTEITDRAVQLWGRFPSLHRGATELNAAFVRMAAEQYDDDSERYEL